jgi:hypothetical protein
MRIIRVAKAGEICDQPTGKNPSGKLDSQLFICPSKKSPSKKKKKKKSEDNSKEVVESKKRKKKKSTEEAEKFEYNPWAVCTKTVGRENKAKYERCVKEVKKKERKKL